MKVFNTNPTYEYKKQPMFFGEDLGVARFEDPKHPKIEEMINKHISQFWRPEEVNLQIDSAQFSKLSPNDQQIFTNNLKYQIIMDRVQSDAPTTAFSMICSDVVLQAWIQTWTFYETIHSRSYTHIIRNLFANPSAVFDDIVLCPELMERAKSITTAYDKLIELTCRLQLAENFGDLDLVYETKKALYLTMHTVNALEAIRFYASFITTFNFQETYGIMTGNSTIMQFIARDENLHHQVTRYIISKWHDGSEGEEWVQIATELRDEASQIFRNVMREEKEWIQWNFKNGAPRGLSISMMCDFIDYASVPQMRKLGLDVEGLPVITRHPIIWLNKYLISSNVQSAPQETEITSYLLSLLDNDINGDILEKFKTRYSF